jgi:hypothetical protein
LPSYDESLFKSTNKWLTLQHYKDLILGEWFYWEVLKERIQNYLGVFYLFIFSRDWENKRMIFIGSLLKTNSKLFRSFLPFHF